MPNPPHRTRWGTLGDGTPAHVWALEGPDGARARILEWGATLASLELPDPSTGERYHATIRLPDARACETNPAYVGSVIGRFANRIRHGRFELDGQVIALARRGTHHLHGGPVHPLSHRRWHVESEGDGLVMRVRSPAGEGGFPGTLDVTLRWHLADGVLSLAMEAHSDAPTHLNLTHHPYFNLAAWGGAHTQRLTLPASRYLPVDGERVVTGEVRAVDESPFDLRDGPLLSEALTAPHPQLDNGGGFDHSWLIEGWEPGSAGLNWAGTLDDPKTGRSLRLDTTLPVIHCFTPGAMDDVTVVDPGGVRVPFPEMGAVALECQFPPDAPNLAHLPSTRLDPGQSWRHTIRYRWG